MQNKMSEHRYAMLDDVHEECTHHTTWISSEMCIHLAHHMRLIRDVHTSSTPHELEMCIVYYVCRSQYVLHMYICYTCNTPCCIFPSNRDVHKSATLHEFDQR